MGCPVDRHLKTTDTISYLSTIYEITGMATFKSGKTKKIVDGQTEKGNFIADFQWSDR